MDTKILKILAPNTRVPTLEIAKKLNSTANTIKNRIKRLVKTGVIHGFRISIDYSKIGYNWYKADLNLKKPAKAFEIVKYIENNPNLWTIIRSLGYVDLELGFILENENKLNQILGDISNKFPETIKNYSYFTIINSHKYQDLPEI